MPRPRRKVLIILIAINVRAIRAAATGVAMGKRGRRRSKWLRLRNCRQ